MNNRFTYLLIFFLFFSLLHSKELVLKIAVTKDLIPYSYQAPNNKIEGLLIDYWKLWSKKTGIKIIFAPLSWKDSLEAIKNNQVDIHMGLFKNKERKKYIKYLNPIYNTNSSLYIKEESKNAIKTLDDLKNKKVAVVNNSFYDNYLTNNYPKIEIVRYKYYKELVPALINKEVSAFINESLVTSYYLSKNNDNSRILRVNNFNLKNLFFAGINIKNKNLEKIVLKGMNKISSNDMIKLEEKWIKNKSFRNLKKINILNLKERSYLEKNKDIKISVVTRWPKYSFFK